MCRVKSAGLHGRWLAPVRELVLQRLVLLGSLVEEEDGGGCSSLESVVRRGKDCFGRPIVCCGRCLLRISTCSYDPELDQIVQLTVVAAAS